MPKVPVLNAPTVGPQNLPGVKQTILTPQPVTSGKALIGQQNQQIGNALLKAGGLVGQAAIQAQDDANSVRVMEAQEEALQAVQNYTYDPQNGYVNIKGRDAFDRQSGKPLSDEYTGRLQEDLNRISQGLGNDAQRKLFSGFAANTLNKFRSSTLQHENKEYQYYKGSVLKGTIENRIADTGLNFNDPNAVAENYQAIGVAATALGRMQGKSAQEIQSDIRSAQSKAISTAMIKALDAGDINLANKYFEAASSSMEPNDVLKIGRALRTENDKAAANGVVNGVLSRYLPELHPNDFTRLVNATMKVESSGRRYGADGKILEGPRTKYGTAKGEMQVLDSTSKNPGYGVKPAADDSPEELARVGRDFLAAMIKEYDGDLMKSLAAYNWGPGNVDKAIKKAEKDGGSWLDNAPGDVKEYAAKIIKDFNSGGGVNVTEAYIRQAALSDPTIVGNPEREALATTALNSKLKAFNEAKKQEQEQVLDNVYKTLWNNGGDLNAIPPSLFDQIPGKELSKVRTFAEQASKGPSEDAWTAIQFLPDSEVASLTPAEFVLKYGSQLTQDKKQLIPSLIEKAQGREIKSREAAAILSEEDAYKLAAYDMGIISELDSIKSDELIKYTQFKAKVNEKTLEFHTDHGRSPTSEERQKILDDMTTDVMYVNRTAWFDREDVPSITLDEDELNNDAYNLVNGEKIFAYQIPGDIKTAIANGLRSRGEDVNHQSVAEEWVKQGKPR